MLLQMRPIERGIAPKRYTKYKDAIGDLEKQLGIYCSYCERPLCIGLAVEHILPKNLHPELETEWNNFLLSCPNCNSLKSDKSVKIEDCCWPDRDNTFLAFAYLKGGFIQPATNLSNEQQIKAQLLLDLVGLQNHVMSGWSRPAARDKRWQDREETWKLAEIHKIHFDNSPRTDKDIQNVMDLAKGYGFFSVWMTVFANYPDIKKELISLFPGTATSCFINGNPINRPGAII
jgi:uncharacterized protein (TIGR02646 family)